MATTFARLCQQVDQTQKELEADIRQLTAKINQLETVQSRSKTLRWVRILCLFGTTKTSFQNSRLFNVRTLIWLFLIASIISKLISKPCSPQPSEKLLGSHSVVFFFFGFLCRHKATELEKQLEEFTYQYLQPQEWSHSSSSLHSLALMEPPL